MCILIDTCIKMDGVVLDRVGILGHFCPKQGQAFKPSAAPLTPKHVSSGTVIHLCCSLQI